MLDALLSVIAPLDCVGCKAEGLLLCENCSKLCIDNKTECFFCGVTVTDAEMCPKCACKQEFKSLTSVGWYKDILKDAVYAYKFGHKRGAANNLATLMKAQPDGDDAEVMYIPTSAVHRRERGFDHAALLARSFAYKNALPLNAGLKRTNNTRQLGGGKRDRKDHIGGVFCVTNSASVKGKHVLLIDDVITTGATLNEAARVLKKAGVKSVRAIVLAKTPITH